MLWQTVVFKTAGQTLSTVPFILQKTSMRPAGDALPMNDWLAHLALRSASVVAKRVPLAHSNPDLNRLGRWSFRNNSSDTTLNGYYILHLFRQSLAKVN
ncbi:MAG: hypothetical protein HFG64_05270 [Lachnospiraceae bacterium]|nr:hypothetical protein [Lachnospiraceae bacterium]